MKYEPHKYQRFAAEFILTHPVAAILLVVVTHLVALTSVVILFLIFLTIYLVVADVVSLALAHNKSMVVISE